MLCHVSCFPLHFRISWIIFIVSCFLHNKCRRSNLTMKIVSLWQTNKHFSTFLCRFFLPSIIPQLKIKLIIWPLRGSSFLRSISNRSTLSVVLVTQKLKLSFDLLSSTAHFSFATAALCSQFLIVKGACAVQCERISRSAPCLCESSDWVCRLEIS